MTPKRVISSSDSSSRERAAVTLEEPVEQEPPRRVGERLEDRVVVHAANNT